MKSQVIQVIQAPLDRAQFGIALVAAIGTLLSGVAAVLAVMLTRG